MNKRWLNRKTHGSSPGAFDIVDAKSRKTPLLANIRDDAIYSLIGLSQGSMSFADANSQSALTLVQRLSPEVSTASYG
jgi:hypothetical protein